MTLNNLNGRNTLHNNLSQAFDLWILNIKNILFIILVIRCMFTLVQILNPININIGKKLFTHIMAFILSLDEVNQA